VVFNNLSHVSRLTESLHKSMVRSQYKVLELLIGLKINDPKFQRTTLVNVYVATVILHVIVIRQRLHYVRCPGPSHSNIIAA
jgi:hypothetical protein